MLAPGIPAMTRDDLLAELLQRYDEERAAGREVTPEQLCRHRPELLAPFTRLLRQLDDVFAGGNAQPPAPIDAGRYTPTEQVGEGGLGVVYRATDGELGRVVALKWMKPLAALNSAARRRFRVEAEITGKLEHPGVAPVYGAGEEPDTCMPYYAMRFIEGQTLADHIRAYHTTPGEPVTRRVEFTRLLRAFTAVCQTVAYAHSRGVVHRDIKPGNVMLGPYGETLLVDWGLAKEFDPDRPAAPTASAAAPVELVPVESAETAGAAQTVSGRAKGTIQYMPPEQARGQWEQVGPAADIYALGATLYTLLAGHSPYSEAKDKLAAVKAGPPRAVRKVNPAAPKPLAAICAKAMARTPAERYATAQGLAADVERWLADEPVTAYRDPLFTRGRRWVKRHRTLTAAVAAALLVLTAALAVVAPVLTAKNQELAKANGDLGKANGDLTEANAAQLEDFEDADATLRGLIDVAFARAIAEPGKFTSALRTDAVHQYRDYLKRFIDRNRDRPEVRVQVAAGWLKLAELDAVLEPHGDAARADAAEAERLFGELKAERPDDREVLYGWAFAAAMLGELLADRGRLADGLALLDPARTVLERVAADPVPVRLARLFSVAGVLDNSPTFRLAQVIEVSADARRRADQVKATAPGEGEKIAERHRAELATALRLIGDRPLPADTPHFTRIKAFSLRLELAQAETDPAKAKAALTELEKELTAQSAEFKTAEFKALVLKARTGLAKADLAAAQRDLAATVGRNDPAAVTAANKAFDAAMERLRNVISDAHAVERADLGFDPFGLRTWATLTPLEITLVRFAALRAVGRYDLNERDMARFYLTALVERNGLSAVLAARGLMLVGEFVGLLAPSGYHRDMEQVSEAGLVLLDRLLAEAPGEPVFVQLKASMTINIAAARVGQRNWPADAAGRAKMLASARDAADTAERLLASAPGDPTDWGPVVIELQLLAVRVGLDATAAPPDGRRAVRACEQLLARVSEGEKLGMPAEVVQVMRLTGEAMLVGALGGQAEDLLNGTPPDLTAARPLLARALELADSVNTRPIPKDADPAVAATMKALQARLAQATPELKALDARANPKR